MNSAASTSSDVAQPSLPLTAIPGHVGQPGGTPSPPPLAMSLQHPLLRTLFLDEPAPIITSEITRRIDREKSIIHSSGSAAAEAGMGSTASSPPRSRASWTDGSAHRSSSATATPPPPPPPVPTFATQYQKMARQRRGTVDEGPVATVPSANTNTSTYTSTSTSTNARRPLPTVPTPTPTPPPPPPPFQPQSQGRQGKRKPATPPAPSSTIPLASGSGSSSVWQTPVPTHTPAATGVTAPSTAQVQPPQTISNSTTVLRPLPRIPPGYRGPSTTSEAHTGSGVHSATSGNEGVNPNLEATASGFGPTSGNGGSAVDAEANTSELTPSGFGPSFVASTAFTSDGVMLITSTNVAASELSHTSSNAVASTSTGGSATTSSAAAAGGIPGLPPPPPPPRPPSRQALQHQKRQEQKRRERELRKEREREKGKEGEKEVKGKEREGKGTTIRAHSRTGGHSRNPSLGVVVLNTSLLASPLGLSSATSSSTSSASTMTPAMHVQARSMSPGRLDMLPGARAMMPTQGGYVSGGVGGPVVAEMSRRRREKSADSWLDGSYRIVKQRKAGVDLAGRMGGAGVGAESAPTTPNLGGSMVPRFLAGSTSPSATNANASKSSPVSAQRPVRPKVNTAFVDLGLMTTSQQYVPLAAPSPAGRPIGGRALVGPGRAGASTSTFGGLGGENRVATRQRTLSASSISASGKPARPILSTFTTSFKTPNYTSDRGYATSTPSSPTMATPTALSGSKLPVPGADSSGVVKGTAATTPTAIFPKPNPAPASLAPRRPLPAPGRTEAGGLVGGEKGASLSTSSPRAPFSGGGNGGGAKDKARREQRQRPHQQYSKGPATTTTTTTTTTSSSSASVASSPPSSAFGSPMPTSVSSASSAASVMSAGGSVLSSESVIVRQHVHASLVGVRAFQQQQHYQHQHQHQHQQQQQQQGRSHQRQSSSRATSARRPQQFSPLEEDSAGPLHSHPMAARELQGKPGGSGSSGDDVISPIVVGRSTFNAPGGQVQTRPPPQRGREEEEGDADSMYTGGHPQELGSLGDGDSSVWLGEGSKEEDDGYYYNPSSNDGLEYVDDHSESRGERVLEHTGATVSRSPSPMMYARPDSRSGLSSSSSPSPARAGDWVEGEAPRPTPGMKRHRQRATYARRSADSSPASSFKASSRRSSLSSSRGDVSSSTGDSMMSVGKNRRRRVRAQLRSYRYSYRLPPVGSQSLEGGEQQWEKGHNSGSGPASNLSHEDVGRGRGRVRGGAGGGSGRGSMQQVSEPVTRYPSKELAGSDDEERKRSRKKKTKNALAQAVSRAFDFDTDREKDKDRDAVETTRFGKKAKMKVGVPPLTTLAHTQDGVLLPSPIGASPMPHHQLQHHHNLESTATAASSSGSLPTASSILDFSFASAKRKTKKTSGPSSAAVLVVDERPGTAESSNSGRSGNFVGLWGKTGEASGGAASTSASAPFAQWVSRGSKVLAHSPPPRQGMSSSGMTRHLEGSAPFANEADFDPHPDFSLPLSSSVAGRPGLRGMRVEEIKAQEALVLDVSSRGSLEPGGEGEEGASPNKKLKKRTASVPTIGLDEIQSSSYADDRAYRDLNKRPFDHRKSVVPRQLGYDSDAGVLSITTSGRRKTRVAADRRELDLVQAIPALRGLKNKGTGPFK